MNRPLMIVATGVVVIVVAIAANFLVWQQEVTEEPLGEQAAAPQAAAKAAADTAEVAAEKAREAARQAAAAKEALAEATAKAKAPEADDDAKEQAAKAEEAAQAAQEQARKAEAEAEAAKAVANAAAQAAKVAEAAPEPGQPQTSATPEATTAATSTAPDAASPAPTAATPDEPVVPSFDVVRINPKGDTVMAGRAAPGSKITIKDRGDVVGEATADARGEWVFVPEKPLPPGTSDLTLESELTNGDKVPSESSVVLVVPEQGKDIAGRPTDEPTQPLALKVPRATPDKVAVPDKPIPSVVLQKPTAGQEARPFTIDAVDYDDQGQLSISGHAPTGAIIQLYLDNKFIGRATAADDDFWSITPEVRVDPGLYTLRADHVDTAGKVLARITIPFARAEPLAPGSGRFVIVQPGNSLWRIARRTYGSGFDYTVIYGANAGQIADPDLIFPGQIFALPKVN